MSQRKTCLTIVQNQLNCNSMVAENGLCLTAMEGDGKVDTRQAGQCFIDAVKRCDSNKTDLVEYSDSCPTGKVLPSDLLVSLDDDVPFRSLMHSWWNVEGRELMLAKNANREFSVAPKEKKKKKKASPGSMSSEGLKCAPAPKKFKKVKGKESDKTKFSAAPKKEKKKKSKKKKKKMDEGDKPFSGSYEQQFADVMSISTRTRRKMAPLDCSGLGHPPVVDLQTQCGAIKSIDLNSIAALIIEEDDLSLPKKGTIPKNSITVRLLSGMYLKKQTSSWLAYIHHGNSTYGGEYMKDFHFPIDQRGLYQQRNGSVIPGYRTTVAACRAALFHVIATSGEDVIVDLLDGHSSVALFLNNKEDDDYPWAIVYQFQNDVYIMSGCATNASPRLKLPVRVS